VAKVADQHGNAKEEEIARGVEWVITQGVDIISISLGCVKYHEGLYNAIQRAISLGKIVVCAAGNAGSYDQFNIRFPATIPGVIRVGSVNAHGRASAFTSIGGAHIDAAGPGESILSTWITPVPLPQPGEQTWSAPFLAGTQPNDWYRRTDGTSMAAPSIAGVIAWLLAYDRSLEVKSQKRPRRLRNAHCVKDLLGRLCFNPSGDLGAGRGTLNLKNILGLPDQFDYFLDQIC
jgi:subtilisin